MHHLTYSNLKKIILLAAFLFSLKAINSQISVVLTIEPPSASNTCDGWVSAYIQTGQSPYTYVWNDTTITSGDPSFMEHDTLWNLCPGVYTLDLFDSAGDSVHLDFFLTSNDLTFGSGSGAIDTIEYSVEDCSLDFSVSVDTAYLNAASIINVFPGANADSIAVEWAIVQQQVTTIVSDTIIGYFPVGSDFVLDAGIYCPDSAFKTQVKVIRVLGLISQSVGINNHIQRNKFSIFPNPSSGEFYLSSLFNSSELIQMSVYRNNGELIQTEQFIPNEKLLISIKSAPGIYLLKFQTGNSIYFDKLIIE